jgi:hypothetical protein
LFFLSWLLGRLEAWFNLLHLSSMTSHPPIKKALRSLVEFTANSNTHFFLSILCLKREDESSIPVEERDAVSWLQRHAHSMKWELPVYEEESRSGEAHDPTFTFRVTVGPLKISAVGSNKKLAKQNAARAAMEAAKGDGHVPEVKTAKVKSHSQNLHEVILDGAC